MNIEYIDEELTVVQRLNGTLYIELDGQKWFDFRDLFYPYEEKKIYTGESRLLKVLKLKDLKQIKKISYKGNGLKRWSSKLDCLFINASGLQDVLRCAEDGDSNYVKKIKALLMETGGYSEDYIDSLIAKKKPSHEYHGFIYIDHSQGLISLSNAIVITAMNDYIRAVRRKEKGEMSKLEAYFFGEQIQKIAPDFEMTAEILDELKERANA